jgi:signal transduction histidine kinase
VDQKVGRLDRPEASGGEGSTAGREPLVGEEPAASRLSRWRPSHMGLSSKLLLATVLFVMLAEVLIFLPSVANFRVNWLMDRLTAARLAALAAEASPTGDIPERLRVELLQSAQVQAVSIKRDGQRQLILTSLPDPIHETYDLSKMRTSDAGLQSRVALVWDALAIYFASGERNIRVIGQPSAASGDIIDIVIAEAPLRSAMLRFGLNILGLSIIISIITAALVYMTLDMLLVRPMMRLAGNMLRFSRNPEDRSRIIRASTRRDEIGTAERELAHMQSELARLLSQKNRLAALGLAVSKINHDLRNLLANVQLLSDRLTSSPDPTVQSFAPKLIASLDRAIAFCNDTLRFGRAEERTPNREVFVLAVVVAEVGEGLRLPRDGAIGWRTTMDAHLKIDADRDHFFRILTNLVRNAIQALEGQGPGGKGEIHVDAVRRGDEVVVRVGDDGPGVPSRAREHLFEAFQGAVRKGGTGLGLAIARELVVAHGGSLALVDSQRGAVFEIRMPDRGSE